MGLSCGTVSNLAAPDSLSSLIISPSPKVLQDSQILEAEALRSVASSGHWPIKPLLGQMMEGSIVRCVSGLKLDIARQQYGTANTGMQASVRPERNCLICQIRLAHMRVKLRPSRTEESVSACDAGRKCMAMHQAQHGSVHKSCLPADLVLCSPPSMSCATMIV